MQERQDQLLSSKTQITHLLRSNLSEHDLLVLSIGSAHLTDTQQQCPNFCLEAAQLGKKVTVINFDPEFKNSAEQLCEEQEHPNLKVYYTALGYNKYDNCEYQGYNPKELNYLVIDFLAHKPKAQVVLIVHIDTDIPKFYKQLAIRNDFVTNYKDRIFFIGSYYQDCSGFVYNQAYIAKHEIYERAAKTTRNDEKIRALEQSFSAAWESLHEFEVQRKEGCIGKTVRKDYGIHSYQEIAPQTDETIGYRFISLAYLSLGTVLQSDFNPKFLAQQRALEVQAFLLNNDNTLTAQNPCKITSNTEEPKAKPEEPTPLGNPDTQTFLEKKSSSATTKQAMIELNVESNTIEFIDAKTKETSEVFKSDSNNEEKVLDEHILALIQKQHAKADIKSKKNTYLKLLEHELNFGNYDKSKFATYLLNHPSHLLKQERSFFFTSTPRYSNDTGSMHTALNLLGHPHVNMAYSSPSL